MRIYIKVTPNASSRDLEEIAPSQFKVRVCASPEKGKANDELVKILSKYFKVAKRQIEIVGGKTSKEKIVDIDK
ncbi:MAG: DUF167 domain-containing protein [Patescibacteria group bacterium]|nr:DUF167 domain-containing protein [Patescibacteria group bacterium]